MNKKEVIVQDMTDGYSIGIFEEINNKLEFIYVGHICYGKYLDKSQAKTWAEKIANYHRKEWENNG